ncbi:MAG: SDR family NAD(P)-dependent oxidoreductase [Beijerinckiaceae bacterium]|nr:SDR family NAD(P)-dependent oxidoreductase [Beijerinckiaceae bacterium]
MSHPALKSRNVAVITGGASGIGLAAAKRFLSLGLRVAIADLPGERLGAAERELGALGVALAVAADISRKDEIVRLETIVRDQLGPVDVLMNNAGIQPGTDVFGPDDVWSAILDTNLLGVIHGTQIFGPGMVARGEPGLIINTGSKQGITTPPGNPAYNVAKAGVKAYTEALQHRLRNTPNCQTSAHLLIPGFVFTGLTANGRVEKPAAAWTPEQTVDFMLESLERGDFYILCPDNDVPRALDEKRILWAAGDIVENRPPLSRWHKDYAGAFERFAKA